MLFSLHEQIEIDLILSEASAFGLTSEVDTSAEVYLKDGCTPIEAYQLAFNEWCN
tara:strand:- start:779 stop:943 length:165 start_codon:yes stop_codon:yes gene_type:complete